MDMYKKVNTTKETESAWYGGGLDLTAAHFCANHLSLAMPNCMHQPKQEASFQRIIISV